MSDRARWRYNKARPKRWSSKSQQKKPHSFLTKRSFKRTKYTFHPPRAPLNTTSYLINTRKMDHHHPMISVSPLLNFNSSPFHGYGSMNTLLAGLCLSEDMGEFNSPRKGVEEGVDLVCWPSHIGIRPKLLGLRITDQESQIAHLEEESLMVKERVVCLERELDGLKHRVKILELTHDAMSVARVCSCDSSFA